MTPPPDSLKGKGAFNPWRMGGGNRISSLMQHFRLKISGFLDMRRAKGWLKGR
jgi:hypothetical protein